MQNKNNKTKRYLLGSNFGRQRMVIFDKHTGETIRHMHQRHRHSARIERSRNTHLTTRMPARTNDIRLTASREFTTKSEITALNASHIDIMTLIKNKSEPIHAGILQKLLRDTEVTKTVTGGSDLKTHLLHNGRDFD